MLTKTKIALAAVLLAGTASLAAAQEADPNLYNRYPATSGATVTQQQGAFQSAPVGLYQGINTAIPRQGRNSQAPSLHRDSAPLISGGGY